MGILNGIDTDSWNPATDNHLRFQYNANDLEGKAENKKALRRHLGLSIADSRRPLVTFFSSWMFVQYFNLWALFFYHFKKKEKRRDIASHDGIMISQTLLYLKLMMHSVSDRHAHWISFPIDVSSHRLAV